MSKKPTMFDNNEYSVKGEGSRHQEQQNVQQMQKKQQNKCVYCKSNNLKPAISQMLCYDCLLFQETPFPEILPLLTVSTRKVIVSGPDGPWEREIWEGNCARCLYWETLPVGIIRACPRCCNREELRLCFYPFP